MKWIAEDDNWPDLKHRLVGEGVQYVEVEPPGSEGTVWGWHVEVEYIGSNPEVHTLWASGEAEDEEHAKGYAEAWVERLREMF